MKIIAIIILSLSFALLLCYGAMRTAQKIAQIQDKQLTEEQNNE